MEKYDKSIDMDSVYREYEKLVYRFCILIHMTQNGLKSSCRKRFCGR